MGLSSLPPPPRQTPRRPTAPSLPLLHAVSRSLETYYAARYGIHTTTFRLLRQDDGTRYPWGSTRFGRWVFLQELEDYGKRIEAAGCWVDLSWVHEREERGRIGEQVVERQWGDGEGLLRPVDETIRKTGMEVKREEMRGDEREGLRGWKGGGLERCKGGDVNGSSEMGLPVEWGYGKVEIYENAHNEDDEVEEGEIVEREHGHGRVGQDGRILEEGENKENVLVAGAKGEPVQVDGQSAEIWEDDGTERKFRVCLPHFGN